MSHVHKGRDLKTLLKRTRAWVSGLGRRPQGGDNNGGSIFVPLLYDFTARKEKISRSLGRVLAKL